jgi:hypothetical protein
VLAAHPNDPLLSLILPDVLCRHEGNLAGGASQRPDPPRWLPRLARVMAEVTA